jgi:hypothetical protein
VSEALSYHQYIGIVSTIVAQLKGARAERNVIDVFNAIDAGAHKRHPYTMPIVVFMSIPSR